MSRAQATAAYVPRTRLGQRLQYWRHETSMGHSPPRPHTIEHWLTKSSNTFRLTFPLSNGRPLSGGLRRICGPVPGYTRDPTPIRVSRSRGRRSCSVSGLCITSDWQLPLVHRHGSFKKPFRRQTKYAAFTGPLTAKGLGDSALRLATHASLAPFSSADPRHPIPAHKTTSLLHYSLLTTRACRLGAACTPDND